LNTRAPWADELPGPGATAVAGDDWFDALFAPVPEPEGPSAIWQAPARPAPVVATAGAAPVAVPEPARGLTSQLPRFLAIGVASTLAYLVLYWVLRGFMPALAANALSLLVTAVANTSANRRLTFGVRGSAGAAKQQVQGLIAFGAGLALSSGALAVLHAVSGSPGRTVELAVLIVANLVATMLRFVLYRLWVFGGAATPAAV
jgi:putative flippase GtrA